MLLDIYAVLGVDASMVGRKEIAAEHYVIAHVTNLLMHSFYKVVEE